MQDIPEGVLLTGKILLSIPVLHKFFQYSASEIVLVMSVEKVHLLT